MTVQDAVTRVQDQPSGLYAQPDHLIYPDEAYPDDTPQTRLHPSSAANITHVPSDPLHPL